MAGLKQVRMLVSRAGVLGSDAVGDVIKVDAAEAKRMIAAGQAELVRGKPVERATAAPAAEKAIK